MNSLVKWSVFVIVLIMRGLSVSSVAHAATDGGHVGATEVRSDFDRFNTVFRFSNHTLLNQYHDDSDSFARDLVGTLYFAASLYSRCERPEVDADNRIVADFIDCMKKNGPADTEAFVSELRRPQNFIPDWLHLVNVYGDILFSKNSTDFFEKLRTYRGKLTESESMILAGMMMVQAGDAYDEARADSDFDSRPRIEDDEVLDLLKHNVIYGYQGYEKDPAGPLAVKKMVCRDDAFFGAKMLKTLGYNSWVVAGQSVSSYHAYVVAQSRETPQKAYRFNYGNIRSSGAADSGILNQGMADAAFNYRIYQMQDQAGRQVANLISDRGAVYEELAGFQIEDHYPLSRKQFQILKSEIRLDEKNQHRISVAHVKDRFGKQYALIGYHYNYQMNKPQSGELGVVVGYENHDNSSYEDSPENTQMLSLYFQSKQNFFKKDYELAPNLTLRPEFFLASQLGVDVTVADSNYSGAVNGHGDVQLYLGGSLRWDDQSNYMAGLSIGAQLVGGVADIRNATAQMPIVLVNYVKISGEFKAKVASHPSVGPVVLGVDATLAMNTSLGVIGEANVSIETDVVNASVGVQGRLSDEAAPFLDGAGRKLKLSLGSRIGNHVVAGISVLIPLESEDGLKIDPTIDGSILVKW